MATDGGRTDDLVRAVGFYKVELYGEEGVLLLTWMLSAETSMDYQVASYIRALAVTGFKITYVPPEQETS